MGFKGKMSGGRNARKRLRQAKESLADDLVIKVGLPKNSSPYPDGTSVVLVGAVHEFGSSTVPARPFLRKAASENREKYQKLSRSAVRKAANGQRPLRKSAELIGQIAEDDVKKEITDVNSPPLKTSTIAKKGSSNPLIDTGHLRSSIRYEVSDRESSSS